MAAEHQIKIKKDRTPTHQVHDSLAVRTDYENLLQHAGDRMRDIFSVQSDQTAARCLQFVRNHANSQGEATRASSTSGLQVPAKPNFQPVKKC